MAFPVAMMMRNTFTQCTVCNLTGSLSSTSYEQLFKNHPKQETLIRNLRGTLLPTIKEEMPWLPGKDAPENETMLPAFMAAVARLNGAQILCESHMRLAPDVLGSSICERPVRPPPCICL